MNPHPHTLLKYCTTAARARGAAATLLFPTLTRDPRVCRVRNVTATAAAAAAPPPPPLGEKPRGGERGARKPRAVGPLLLVKGPPPSTGCCSPTSA